MWHFAATVGSHDAQLRSRWLVEQARADPEHPDHGKELPYLIPRRLVKMMQVSLEQSHTYSPRGVQLFFGSGVSQSCEVEKCGGDGRREDRRFNV